MLVEEDQAQLFAAWPPLGTLACTHLACPCKHTPWRAGMLGADAVVTIACQLPASGNSAPLAVCRQASFLAQPLAVVCMQHNCM